MPNMNGYELSKKITELHHDMPIILCSGYSEDLEEKVNTEFTNAIYTIKPIRTEKLNKKIYSLLKHM